MSADLLAFSGLLAGFAAFRALAIALPRGDTRRIDTGVVVVGVCLIRSTPAVLLASIVSGLIGAVASRFARPDRFGSKVMREWAMTTASSAVGILVLHALSGGAFSVPAVGDARLYSALLQGVVYASICEAGWLLANARSSMRRGSMQIAEPVWLTHLVHITLAAAGLRAADSLGSVAVVFCLVLALLLQYGLMLYVRMRAAYAQTIRGVSRAIELALIQKNLDWESLADLAVSVGRRLGCRPRTLEALNDAALLCGLGLVAENALEDPGITLSGKSSDLAYLSRSAAAVARIPRLEMAAAIMDPEVVAMEHGGDVHLAADVLRCCLVYAHALKKTQDRRSALEAVVRAGGGCNQMVIDAIRDSV